MSLADHPSPPTFKRGFSPTARLAIFVALSMLVLVADLRFRYLEVLRQGLSVVTHPLQLAAAAPVDFVRNAGVYFATLVEVQFENAELRRSQLEAAQRLLRFEQLERENESLRRTLAMSRSVEVLSLAAEILYDAPDPFARKVIIDKGVRHGVVSGLAVVDARGMIGQVTRVYPIQSEVTLINDKDQSVPVKIERTGQRSVLVGAGKEGLELRHVNTGSDIVVGDRLVTSGLDGFFLAGLPVAEVSAVDNGDDIFLIVKARPLAQVERAVQVLVLGRAEPAPSRPRAADAVSLSVDDVLREAGVDSTPDVEASQ